MPLNCVPEIVYVVPRVSVAGALRDSRSPGGIRRTGRRVEGDARAEHDNLAGGEQQRSAAFVSERGHRRSVEQVHLAAIAVDEHVAVGQKRGKVIARIIAVGEVGTGRPLCALDVVDCGMPRSRAAAVLTRTGCEDRSVGAQDRRTDLTGREIAVLLLGSVGETS